MYAIGNVTAAGDSVKRRWFPGTAVPREYSPTTCPLTRLSATRVHTTPAVTPAAPMSVSCVCATSVRGGGDSQAVDQQVGGIR